MSRPSISVMNCGRRIELRLHLPPVVTGTPVANELLKLSRAVRPAIDQKRSPDPAIESPAPAGGGRRVALLVRRRGRGEWHRLRPRRPSVTGAGSRHLRQRSPSWRRPKAGGDPGRLLRWPYWYSWDSPRFNWLSSAALACCLTPDGRRRGQRPLCVVRCCWPLCGEC